MFSSVSWHDFIMVICIILVIYYSVVLFLFYRIDILNLLRELNSVPVPDTFPPPSSNEPALFSGVHDLLDELKAIFQQAADKKYHKEELLMAVQSTIKNYRQLKDTPFEEAINNQVILESLSECHIELEAAEVRRLWE